MENGYNYVDIGYELWKRGYPLRRSGPSGNLEAYDLYVQMLDEGIIADVDGFLAWVLAHRPTMVYNQVEEDEKYRRENEPLIRKYFAEHPEHFDPRQYLTGARANVKAVVAHKIKEVLGSEGKAADFE